jgi:predicted amino acid-binding ACT domain protein
LLLLFLLGKYSPGLLASISESILAAGLSIENVHTALRRGVNGRFDFVCEIDCVAVTYMDREHLEEMVSSLNLLKERHNLEVCDVRVQRLQRQSIDEK